MFYCWYWLFTYLQLGAHRWVKFRFWQTLTYMIFYLDGAPQEAGYDPDVSAASQYGGLACLPPVWVGTTAR